MGVLSSMDIIDPSGNVEGKLESPVLLDEKWQAK
jgi:hypothetical protein